MGYFSKFRHFYTEPERIDRNDPSQVRRRVERELERVRTIEDRRSGLSQANQFHIQVLQDTVARLSKAEFEARRARERHEFAPTDRTERDHNAARSRLFNLTQRVARLQRGLFSVQRLKPARASQGQQARSSAAKPSGGDRRQFNFSDRGQQSARTVFGTEAFTNILSAQSFAHKPKFLSAHLVIPCIQRVVRREVMFAQKKAGKGYRKPHRRSPFSDIGC